MNNKKTLKSENGFTGSDIIISVIIIVLFVSIITTSFYNYYMSIQAKNRKAIATNIIIDVIENVEMMNYDDITQNTVENLITNLKNDGTIQTAYDVTATLEKYTDKNENKDKMDLIKTLTVLVKYKVGNKEEQFEIKRLITKY